MRAKNQDVIITPKHLNQELYFKGSTEWNNNRTLQVPFVWRSLRVRQSMNWPSMTTKYVLSIRLCYREITQQNREGRKAMKFLELPQLTRHNPIILPKLVADLHLLSQSHFIS